MPVPYAESALVKGYGHTLLWPPAIPPQISTQLSIV